MYKRIINLTFLPVFQHKVALMKALFIPLVLIILLGRLPVIYEGSQFVLWSSLLIIFLLNITIAITTHRILLLGDESVPSWGLFKFGQREVSFLITSFLLGLIMTPIIIFMVIPFALKLGSTLISITTVLSILMMAIVLSRLSLALPSIAIDNKISFKDAWIFTKHYKVLTFFTIIIFPTIFAIVIGIIYNLVIAFMVTVVWSEFSFLYSVLDVFIAVFIISALSATYQVLHEDHPAYFKETFNEDEVIESLNHGEITITNNSEQLIINPNDYSINFDLIKEELLAQYKELGFNNIVVDKENSWMVKNPEIDNAYIALNLNDNEYNIETYNVQDVDLDVFMNKEKKDTF